MNDAKMNLTIKGATDSELSSIEYRLRRESEIQELIRRIRRNSKSINYGRDQVEEGVPLSIPINELYHYGIKGMKWGIRRYQNPDGTRTAVGKRRDRKASSTDHKTVRALKKKPVKRLTNEELQTLNKRMQLEVQYKNLKKQDVRAGRQFISKMVTSVASEIIRQELKSAAKKAINPDEDKK